MLWWSATGPQTRIVMHFDILHKKVAMLCIPTYALHNNSIIWRYYRVIKEPYAEVQLSGQIYKITKQKGWQNCNNKEFCNDFKFLSQVLAQIFRVVYTSLSALKPNESLKPPWHPSIRGRETSSVLYLPTPARASKLCWGNFPLHLSEQSYFYPVAFVYHHQTNSFQHVFLP